MTYTKAYSIGMATLRERKRAAGIRNPPPVRLTEAMRREKRQAGEVTTRTKPVGAVQSGL